MKEIRRYPLIRKRYSKGAISLIISIQHHHQEEHQDEKTGKEETSQCFWDGKRYFVHLIPGFLPGPKTVCMALQVFFLVSFQVCSVRKPLSFATVVLCSSFFTYLRHNSDASLKDITGCLREQGKVLGPPQVYVVVSLSF